MKKNTQFVIGMLICSALIAGSVFCETGACSSGERGGRYKEKRGAITRELGLTAEQDKLLKDAKEAHRAEMAELFQALKAKRQELKSALVKPGVTRQQVEPIAAEIKTLQSQMVDRRIDGILKVKGILSPEQFQKLQGMKEGWQKNGHMKHFGKER